MVFYTAAQFPSAYRGDAFITMHGSWNRYPPAGFKVVRLRFRHGQPVGFEDFLTGFLVEKGRAHFGRVAGLVVAPDGALLVSDDANGTIYRITHGDRIQARVPPSR
jgi:glucose/arabinose dehydrogenase